ncbi:recombinase family protein [Pedobacter sp. ASV12]|uniref:recombinase family protein n=1 Tax=Pedobacter sp. ASV12 TaxID=2795120 RepID=UPI0018ED20D7|nr:recombinase family protein [Pedobacter sp. ASV12]
MKDPIKAGIWIRVSTDMQVKDESPEHHELRAKHYINAKGWNLVKIYRLDGISGKTVMKHPETQRMLNDVRNGEINGLVFSKLSRLARSTKELLEFAGIFKTEKANLISISENIDTSTPSGMLFFTVISAMAEWEREEISNRVSSSIPIRAKLGKPLGGQAIFGYSWHNKEYVINELEAPIRKLIYEIFLRTLRKKTTADELNKLGYRTRKGALFSDTTVARLLRDTTAKGERIANYTKTGENGKCIVLKPKSEWTVMKCPQIISEQLWDKANLILTEQERKSKRVGRRSAYLLSGFVKCSCSKKMYVKRTKVYQCKDCKVKIKVSDIEGIFWNFLSDCLNSIDLAKLMEDSNSLLSKKQALFEETMNEHATLEKKIQRYVGIRMDREITREEFVGNLHTLNAQLAHLEAFLQKLKSEMDLEARQIRLREDQVKEAKLLATDWSIMVFERKRSIIEAITNLVSIGNTSVIIEFSINLHSLLRGKNIQCSGPDTSPCLLFDREFRKPAPQTYPENPATIGEQIRKKRIDKSLTQAELAKILNVSTDCIIYWENNRSKPQISYYPRIHHFLGFSTTTFDETNFGGRIRTYRWRNGISRKDIARLLKVDISTVRAWEKGLNMPSQKRINEVEVLLQSRY